MNEKINMNSARVISVLETTLLRRGKGKDGDPVRIITQYWTPDGKLLAEVDPCKETMKSKEGTLDEPEGEWWIERCEHCGYRPLLKTTWCPICEKEKTKDTSKEGP